jgi:formate dehydrogenase subunit gamma
LRLLRFDGVQRTAHWVNAVLFGIVMFTAIPLYFGSFFGVTFPRHVIEEIHLWSGLMLPVPILISLLGPWGRQMREDVHRFSYWTRSELRWLTSLGRSGLVADKFNPGQKANALFVGSSIVVMWATGFILQWFRFFPVSWRTGATTTHDLFAFALFAVVGGHVLMAVTHPESLGSMLDGTISERWAERHAKAWLDEKRAQR